MVGSRLRELRESKKFSQGDIEKRTGLLRCYISRVENGHTVPAIETLEKMARALEVPMYRLFHDGEVPAGMTKINRRRMTNSEREARPPITSPNCAGFSPKWSRATKNYCCTWLRKLRETSRLVLAQCYPSCLRTCAMHRIFTSLLLEHENGGTS